MRHPGVPVRYSENVTRLFLALKNPINCSLVELVARDSQETLASFARPV